MILSAHKDYPPHWKTFTQYVGVAGPESFGFSCQIGDVNRFAARYRAARCFRHVAFEGVTNSTAEGYSALCQLLLTYSAFEHLLKCLGRKPHQASPLLSDEERDRALKNIRKLNGQRELFIVIHNFSNDHNKKQIEEHIGGRDCSPFALAASMRHAFAHGVLAANPVNAPETSVATVGRYMCRLLMTVMDREFESRMKEFEEGVES